MRVIGILFLGIAILATGCKGRKNKLAKANNQEVTISMQYTEMPCGGIEPPEDIRQQMDIPKPMASESLKVYRFNGPDNFEFITNLILDKNGIAIISIDTGKYVVSKYDLNPAPTVDSTGAPADMSNKAQCELQWARMTAFPLRITAGKTAYELLMMKECNPCEEPKP
ncbi:MAG: hypothetical protein H6607_11655 [Flavobacteriales bacterium]|nr:hypothetical protein [Flavobacteriales bacterium]